VIASFTLAVYAACDSLPPESVVGQLVAIHEESGVAVVQPS
jgi:hypothetical protein